MEENLDEIIQFTATGYFRRGSVNSFAIFLGYQDTIAISTSEAIPNPLTKVQYVEKHIKDLLIDVMAQMNINVAKESIEQQYQNQLSQVEEFVKTEVATTMTVTTDILPTQNP